MYTKEILSDDAEFPKYKYILHLNASRSTHRKRTTGAIYSASLAVGWGVSVLSYMQSVSKQYPNIIDSLFSVGSKRKLTTGPL